MEKDVKPGMGQLFNKDGLLKNRRSSLKSFSNIPSEMVDVEESEDVRVEKALASELVAKNDNLTHAPYLANHGRAPKNTLNKPVVAEVDESAKKLEFINVECEDEQDPFSAFFTSERYKRSLQEYNCLWR